MAISRSDLVAALAEKTDQTKTTADAVLSAFTDVLLDAVAKGEKVSIPGWLAVERTDRAARTGRNPQTGATIEIAASSVPKFTAGATLKAAVNK